MPRAKRLDDTTIVMCRGSAVCVSEASRATGVPVRRILARINAGMTGEALFAPLESRNGMKDRVRFHEDPACIAFVHDHPGGATLDEVAAFLGCSRERVRQLETSAIEKLRNSGVDWRSLDVPQPEHPLAKIERWAV